MSFRGRGGSSGDRGRGGGAPRGGGGGGFGGGRGGGRGGYGGGDRADLNNPESIVEYGTYVHASENDMVFKVINHERVPKFNSPVFLENKTPFGVIDEILGPVKEVYFTVKPKNGFTANSFEKEGKCYIGTDRLLPAKMFLEAEKPRGGRGGGRGGGAGGRGGRGGGGFGGGGRGAPRGGGGGRGGPRGGGGFGGGRGGGMSRGGPRGGGGGGRGRF